MTLCARELAFGYDPARPVFEGLTLGFEEGVTVILGPNGAGKSTLVRLLMGALKPDRGVVELHGDPVRGLRAPARAARLAYVAQRPSVASAFTVREVVALGRYALSLDEGAIDLSIDRLGLGPFAGRVFASLSVGEQQRVSLARALAQLHKDGDDDPRRVLLADEPTSAMDPRWVAHCAGVIRSLPSLGIDPVVVLHDFTLASRLADRVIVLDQNGAVACDGAPGDALDPAKLGEVFGTLFSRFETADGPVIHPVVASGSRAT